MSTVRMRGWAQRVALLLTTLSVGMVFNVSCSAAWDIFRSEATQGIGSGVKTAMSGVVDGIVAIIDPSDAQSQSAASQ